MSHRLDRSAPRAAGVPIYLATLFSVGAIIATIIAAPIMLSVGSLGNDPGALQWRPRRAPTGRCCAGPLTG